MSAFLEDLSRLYISSLNIIGANTISNIIISTIVCVLAIWTIATFWTKQTKHNKSLKALEMFLGPKRFPILGSIVSSEMRYIAFNPTKLFLDCMESLTKRYGKIFCFWLFNEPKVMIADADAAIKLFNEGSILNKASDFTNGAKAIGEENLMVIHASIHSQRRRQWNQFFTRKQVEYSVPYFIEQAIRLCEKLREYQTTGKTFDFVPLSMECTFWAICCSAFGKEYMSTIPNSVGREHIHDLHTISRNMTMQALQPWNSNYFLYFYGTSKGRETLKCLKRASLLTEDAVKARQKCRKMEPKSSNEFTCFLDLLLNLEANGDLTKRQVVQELNGFILAGNDTSGLAICYVLYFLSLYPEHQEKIVKELCNITPSEYWNYVKDYRITTSNTKELKHLELCIKEALRLYPILPVSPRRTTQKVELPDGRVIPENVDVNIMLNLIHRDPKYFPQPEKFIPERHLQPIPAFMPFTLGSRNCIGQTYAMYEMKVILAYLLMAFKWETIEEEDFKPIFQTLLVPENGMKFRITARVF